VSVRIAMWSGPRNISTALMRSWGNRPDTAVVDEPLYAHYLKVTGVEHPGRDEVIARHECDWRVVVAGLTGPIPGGRDIYYQKHMAHHLLPEIERDWLADLTHAFLIRDPAEMLTSLIRVTPHPRIEDTGLPQQVRLIQEIEGQTRRLPPIVDSRDVLSDPRGVLGRLCERLGVAFREEMLSWPAGPRDTDGVWARFWYAAVEKSSGFEPYRPKSEPVPAEFAELARECRKLYDWMYARRLR
jgi:Sulfotransferase domain